MSATVEHVRAEDLLDDPEPTERAPSPGVGHARHLAGVALAVAGLPLLTLLLRHTSGALSLEAKILLYLLAVVAISLVGGLAVALVSSIAAAFLINYYFVEPRHTLSVEHADQAVALGVFVVVAGVVSGAVEIAARRARAAEQATAEAETLSALAAPEQGTLSAVLANARATFGMESVALLRREGSDWVEVERSGWAPHGDEAPLRFDVPAGRGLRMVGRGPALFAEDRRVLRAFAGAALAAHEAQQLDERRREARQLGDVDRQRTALLAAVGHDLRTPLAGIKAGVSSLRQGDVEWSEAEREELLAGIEESADRLDAVVRNLLDASRLQAGVLAVHAEPVALADVASAAVLAVPGATARIEFKVPDDLPPVQADAGLLERVLVNLIDNALRHGTSDRPVELVAFAGERSAKLAVIDHGRGLSDAREAQLFEPFSRLDDRETHGVGLGLAVARGFVEAMGGWIGADTTDGGGLTMRLRLPLAAS